jgi:hypothetical protein
VATQQLRLDIAQALRSKNQAQTRLKNVEKQLEISTQKQIADAAAMKQMSSDLANLTVKIRDRDEELVEKAKLLEVCIVNTDD